MKAPAWNHRIWPFTTLQITLDDLVQRCKSRYMTLYNVANRRGFCQWWICVVNASFFFLKAFYSVPIFWRWRQIINRTSEIILINQKFRTQKKHSWCFEARNWFAVVDWFRSKANTNIQAHVTRRFRIQYCSIWRYAIVNLRPMAWYYD